MTDRANVAGVTGRDPITVERRPDDLERVPAVMHYWRVFQALRTQIETLPERNWLTMDHLGLASPV